MNIELKTMRLPTRTILIALDKSHNDPTQQSLVYMYDLSYIEE